MPVMVNGKPEPLPQPPTLAALLTQVAPRPPFAVACNGDFVPRSAYDQHHIHVGDEIEIVHPAAGGLV